MINPFRSGIPRQGSLHQNISGSKTQKAALWPAEYLTLFMTVEEAHTL